MFIRRCRFFVNVLDAHAAVLPPHLPAYLPFDSLSSQPSFPSRLLLLTHGAMSACTWKHVCAFEAELMKRWYKQGKPINDIAELLGRDRTTVSEHVHTDSNNEPPNPVGRPRKIQDKEWSKLEKALHALVSRAKAQKEVTMAMVIKKARLNVCEKVAREAFHAHDIYFHKIFEKPVLEPEDVPARRDWCEKRLRRTKQQWLRQPHAIIDNKTFALFHTKKGRAHAARRSLRGVYRKAGAKPVPHLVRQKSTVKFPAPSAMVTAAVIKGRIRMWHYIDGRWNATAAAKMYTGPLRRALKRAYPEVERTRGGTYTVLEDNDPAGYKSRAGCVAKKGARIKTDDLPRRSPDLNVLDYSLWHEINVRMRKQEAAFPANEKETKDAYLLRLRKTAMGLPTKVVESAVASMHNRVRKVVAARGGLFKE